MSSRVTVYTEVNIVKSIICALTKRRLNVYCFVLDGRLLNRETLCPCIHCVGRRYHGSVLCAMSIAEGWRPSSFCVHVRGLEGPMVDEAMVVVVRERVEVTADVCRRT